MKNNNNWQAGAANVGIWIINELLLPVYRGQQLRQQRQQQQRNICKQPTHKIYALAKGRTLAGAGRADAANASITYATQLNDNSLATWRPVANWHAAPRQPARLTKA